MNPLQNNCFDYSYPKMKSISLLLLFLLSANLYAQDVAIHYLENPDPVVDCTMIKSGKFLNEETPNRVTPGYSIEIRGNTVTELINDGAFYMKSRINFTSECGYELTILESTLPGDESVGEKVNVEILSTSKADNLIMIKTFYTEQRTFVLKKVQN